MEEGGGGGEGVKYTSLQKGSKKSIISFPQVSHFLHTPVDLAFQTYSERLLLAKATIQCTKSGKREVAIQNGEKEQTKASVKNSSHSPFFLILSSFSTYHSSTDFINSHSSST